MKPRLRYKKISAPLSPLYFREDEIAVLLFEISGMSEQSLAERMTGWSMTKTYQLVSELNLHNRAEDVLRVLNADQRRDALLERQRITALGALRRWDEVLLDCLELVDTDTSELSWYVEQLFLALKGLGRSDESLRFVTELIEQYPERHILYLSRSILHAEREDMQAWLDDYLTFCEREKSRPKLEKLQEASDLASLEHLFGREQFVRALIDSVLLKNDTKEQRRRLS